jgi:hypothetical protein
MRNNDTKRLAPLHSSSMLIALIKLSQLQPALLRLSAIISRYFTRWVLPVLPSHSNDEMVLQRSAEERLRWQDLYLQSFAQACS